MIKYKITELPPSPTAFAAQSYAWDINEHGMACGSDPTQALRWDAGTPIVLGDDAIYAHGLNDLGEVVGETGQPHAYLFTTDGQVQDLGAMLGGGPSTAFDINGNGVIVGAVRAYVSPRPFIYNSKQAGQPLILDPLTGDKHAVATAVNESGHVIGWSESTNWEQENRAFIWRGGTGVEELGTVWTIRALNDTGVAIGMKHFTGPKTDGGYQMGNAFRLDTNADPPTFEDLGHSVAPGYTGSEGYDINDAGAVVGWSYPDYAHGSTQLPRAFVHFPPTSDYAGFHELQDLVVNPAGWQLFEATAVNNSGAIVGEGLYNEEWRGFLLTPDDSIDFPAKLVGYLEEFVLMVGGASKGGGGLGFTYGFKPHPIPPHEPFAIVWKRLTPTQRDITIAFAIRRLASAASSPANRELIERASSDLIERAVRELDRR